MVEFASVDRMDLKQPRFPRISALSKALVCLVLIPHGLVLRPALADGVDPEVTEEHVLTQRDRVPRFCNSPDVTALASGAWSNPSVWSTGVVPGPGARVLVPANITVTYDLLSDTEINCVEVADQGALRWETGLRTRLRILNLQVLPGGTLIIGEKQDPVASAVAAEIIFPDVALDTAGRDPAQYGNGLHVFGTVRMHGALLERTFLRFAREASAGETLLHLEAAPQGWKPGDRLIIPDTRHIPFRKNYEFVSQAEEPLVSSLNGSTVVLGGPLAYDHYGPRDGDGNVGPVELSMLPHVGNLTRNVVIRSVDLGESPKSRYCLGEEALLDTENCVTRGHVMVHARASVDVRYAAFRNLGRTTTEALDNTTFDEEGLPVTIGTNQIGRYSFHCHHLAGPVNPTDTGLQYLFVGNVIEGFLKWGLAVHNTHFGLIKDNLVYDGNGSAIATEDGNESFNIFARNFIVHTKAGDTEQIREKPGRAGVEDNRRRFGFTRDGFWFSGMNNYVRDNVVANAPGFACNYNGYYLDPDQAVPDFRGADIQTDSTIRTAPPVLQSVRNEAYGATGQGLWLTWSRGCCNVGLYDKVSLFQDYRIWHVYHSGVEAYHENRNTFAGFVLRNDRAVSENSQGGSLRFNRGFNFANSSYENGRTIFLNLDVQGFNVGIMMPRRPEDKTEEPNFSVVAYSFLKNYVNIQQRLPNIDEGLALIINVVFEPLDIALVPDQPDEPVSIEMRYGVVDKNTDFVDKHSRTIVLNFDGVPGQSFLVFFEEQGPEFPIPPPPFIDHPNYQVCPEPDLTNLECWTLHGVAVGGEVAPCIELDGDASCSAASGRASQFDIEGLIFP